MSFSINVLYSEETVIHLIETILFRDRISDFNINL